jgi:hypothetical protein
LIIQKDWRINIPTKPKTGEKVSWKQFFHEWKEGMKNVTPLQQCVAMQFGQIVTLIGIIWGIIFSIILGYWWMGVILLGGLIVLAVQMLANWQKKVILKQMELIMKESEPMNIGIQSEQKVYEIANPQEEINKAFIKIIKR